jgi:hypothetical protein
VSDPGTGRTSRRQHRTPRATPVDGAGLATLVRTPFGRLAVAHLLSVAGDALVAMALAGSLFFDVDPSGARWRIALYLLFTMAPFAVVGPLIGPAMDRARGGHQYVLVGSAVGRALLAVLMVSAVANDSLLLFPEAFLMLVLAKTYQVAKAAVVPTVVGSDAELVEANSKLQLLSGLGGFAAGIPGALMLLIGAGHVMALAAVAFTAAVVATAYVPRTTVATEPPDSEERAELRSAAVLTASSAMGMLRAIVGFVTFLLAFALRGDTGPPPTGTALGRLAGSRYLDEAVTTSDILAPVGPPAWHFGVILVCSVGGGLLGAAVSPLLRRRYPEEYLLAFAVALAVVAGGVGVVFGGLFGQSALALLVAVSATSAKQAFDAVVQRDAPDANRGRFFARFESRFQVAWVLGAFIPVLVPLPTQLGSVLVAVAATAAGALYLAGMLAVRRGQQPPRLPTVREVGGNVARSVSSRRSQRRGRRDQGGGPDRD